MGCKESNKQTNQVFLKEFFKIVDFENKSGLTTKSMQNYPGGKDWDSQSGHYVCMVLKMLSAYYICYVYPNSLNNTFIIKTNTRPHSADDK